MRPTKAQKLASAHNELVNYINGLTGVLKGLELLLIKRNIITEGELEAFIKTQFDEAARVAPKGGSSNPCPSSSKTSSAESTEMMTAQCTAP